MPSEKILVQKKEAVVEFTALLQDAKAGVLVDYRGLTVEQDTKMRSELRAAGVEYKVIKNTLARYSIKEAGLDGLDTSLAGPTAWAISNNDLVAPAKIIAKFAKDFEALEIKAGFMEGNVLNVAEVDQLAKLPSKEELIAKVMAGLNTPATGLVGVLNGSMRALAIALNALAEKKQAAGE